MRIKSPIFYMGNKYDLLDDLLAYFPKKEEVETFIDLFGGSGVVVINSKYEKNIYNELNKNVYDLFNLIVNTDENILLSHINKMIKKFDLLIYDTAEKTKGNDLNVRKGEKQYYKFREYYNKNKNVIDLFLLTYYSFNNYIRFNSDGNFNMPYGNRKFLPKEHTGEILRFKHFIKNKKIIIKNENAFKLLENITKNEQQFIYLDPPYTNTMAVYNEQRAGGGWNIEDDIKLFKELDRLNELGIKWAMSNVLWTKGIHNKHIEQWAKNNNYKIITFEEKKYNLGDNINQYTEEVLIINYVAPFEKFDIFDFMED